MRNVNLSPNSTYASPFTGMRHFYPLTFQPSTRMYERVYTYIEEIRTNNRREELSFCPS